MQIFLGPHKQVWSQSRILGLHPIIKLLLRYELMYCLMALLPILISCRSWTFWKIEKPIGNLYVIWSERLFLTNFMKKRLNLWTVKIIFIFNKIQYVGKYFLIGQYGSKVTFTDAFMDAPIGGPRSHELLTWNLIFKSLTKMSTVV